MNERITRTFGRTTLGTRVLSMFAALAALGRLGDRGARSLELGDRSQQPGEVEPAGLDHVIADGARATAHGRLSPPVRLGDGRERVIERVPARVQERGQALRFARLDAA